MLDAVRVLQISLMFQSFNLKFTSPLNSLVSVLLLMLPLFGIHSLKTFVHHPLLPLLEETQSLSLRKGLSSLAHFLLWLLRGADLFLSLDFEFCILLLSCCALECTTQWRLRAIKVKLELELLFISTFLECIFSAFMIILVEISVKGFLWKCAERTATHD